MKKSKLDNLHIKDKVVKGLTVGKSQTKIAREIGISQSQISQFASRGGIKDLIEQEQTKLFDCVPDAFENINRL